MLCHIHRFWSILVLFILITVHEKTDYQSRTENGENWRPFWWYNATALAGRWPPDETDTLGGNGMAVKLLYCCIV